MAVAQHKSVHAGARAIHISQSAMTQRIRNLETNLGVSLFVRTHSGMEVTSEGISLLRYCHIANQLSVEALADMMGAGIEQPLRVKISGPSSVMSTRIVPCCMTVIDEYPQLTFTFEVDDSDLPVKSLTKGISQFVIIPSEKVPEDVESKTLLPERYILVCTSRWKGRKLKDIITSERIIDFDESDQMSYNYLRAYGLLEYAKPERLFVNRTDSLLHLLAAGYGYGVLTKEFSNRSIKNGELIALNSAKSYNNCLSLAWYKRPDPPKYLLSLINAIA